MRDLPVRVRDMACVKIEIVQNVPIKSKTNNLLHDNRKIKLLPEGKQ